RGCRPDAGRYCRWRRSPCPGGRAPRPGPRRSPAQPARAGARPVPAPSRGPSCESAPLTLLSPAEGGRGPGTVVGLVEELDDVEDLDGRARGAESLGDLDDAAGVRGDDGLGPRLPDMSDLPLLQTLRHLGLDEVIGPGRAAAPVGLGQLHER